MVKNFIYLILVLVCVAQTTQAQNSQKIKFHRIPDGISNNWVSSIIQDRQGFLWFGTAGGLDRFDGYAFANYEHDQIGQRRINGIYEDRKGGLWISTDGLGLHHLDRVKNIFTSYRQNTGDVKISSDIVSAVYEDQEGILWLGTNDGLNALNPKTGKIQRFASPQILDNWGGGYINSIIEDALGNLWLATAHGGLARFDKKTGKFTHFTTENAGLKSDRIQILIKSRQKDTYWIGYRDAGVALISLREGKFKIEKYYAHAPQNPQSISGNNILSMCETQDGRLWVGVENHGVSILNPKNETFTTYLHDKNDEFSLSHDSPWSIYEDSFGNIWIGTFNQGVNVVYNQYYDKFEQYTQKSGQSNSLVNNNISGFLEAHDGKIWIATDGGGLSRWDRKNNVFTNFTAQGAPTQKLSNQAILSLCEDPQKNLWFGTWEGGINLYNFSSQSFSVINKQNHQLSSNTHFSISSCKDGNLYMASWEGTLDVFDPVKKEVLWSRNFYDQGVNFINNIFEDSHENLWIGSANGLVLITKQNRHPKGKYQVFKHLPDQANSLSENNINDIFEDSQGNIWIGTIRGLNKYRPKNKDFKIYRKKDGLINDNIKSITEDLKGILWLISDKGLISFDPRQGTFENYRKDDGLLIDAGSRAFIYRTQAGEILVGGANGFNIFNPNKLLKNPFKPRVFFTGLKIFNKPVPIQAKNSPLKQSMEFTQSLVLTHKQSMFTIEFVAINYIRSQKTQYAYFMEGLDKEWNYVDNKREANYTAIPAGSYTFRVKAANNDGLWGDEEAVLHITILPPWWETWWFRVSVLFSIIAATVFGVRYRIQMIKAQNIRLEKLVEERTHELKEKNDEVLQQAEELHQQAEELHQQAEELTVQRDYIQAQNMQLSAQNKIVEEKSQRLRQSIQAAQTIQEAILPHKGKLAALLQHYFLIYRPKDVVSGDFYWISKIENTTILVVADCTGHGVPGAFMTLIGSTLLDKIIKIARITKPGQILTRLHEEVYDVLKQKHTLNNNGMDAIVITITPLDDQCSKVQFAGAKNPVFFVDSRSKSNIIEIRGARRGIGGQQNEKILFETQELELSKESLIYLGTDGYADQNNIKRKKFGTERLKKLIKLCAHLPICEQQKYFEKALDDYSKGTLQRDDILMIGLSI
ncbi:MAG: two-component regulator propeller domain-containing protein [Microscillaceae bacterium]|nr:two-component regulator propeller domain-containing protein [Microscillaceae bacterium]